MSGLGTSGIESNESGSPSGGTSTNSIPTELAAVPVGAFMASGSMIVTWLVGSVYPTKAVGLLAGPPKIGKSLALLDLVVSAAGGVPWMGRFPVTKGRVLLIDEESSDVLLRNRLAQLAKGRCLELRSLDIHIMSRQGLNLSSKESSRQLETIIRELKPSVVVLDSWIRVHRAKENESWELARVNARIARMVVDFDTTFIISDHTKKLSGLTIGVEEMLRGSNEKAAFADSALTIVQRGKHRQVVHSLPRYGEAIKSFRIRIVTPTADSLVVECYDSPDDEGEDETPAEAARQFIVDLLSFSPGHTTAEILDAAAEAGYSANSIQVGLASLRKQNVIVPTGKQARQPGERGPRATVFGLTATDGKAAPNLGLIQGGPVGESAVSEPDADGNEQA